MRTNRTGFTLIELLVVIAIIAVLAAILFPVFAKAKDSARQSTCANNLKQIGFALTQYIQDNNDTFPPLRSSASLFIMNQNYPSILDPYMKTKKFICPSDMLFVKLDKYRDESGNPWFAYASYGYNSWYLAGQDFYGSPAGTKAIAKFSALRRPSRTLTFADKKYAYEPAIIALGYSYTFNNGPCKVADTLGTWHNSGPNVLYADSHVKWTHPSDLTDRKKENLWDLK